MVNATDKNLISQMKQTNDEEQKQGFVQFQGDILNEDLENQVTVLQNQLREQQVLFEIKKKEYEDKLDLQHKEHQAEIKQQFQDCQSKLNFQVKENNAQFQTPQKDYKDQIDQLSQQYQAQLSNQALKFQIKLDNQQNENQAKLTSLQKENENKLIALSKEYQGKIDQLTKDNQAKLDANQKERQTLLDSLSKENLTKLYNQSKEFQLKLDNQSKEYQIKLETLSIDYQAKLDYQSKETEKFKNYARELEGKQQQKHQQIPVFPEQKSLEFRRLVDKILDKNCQQNLFLIPYETRLLYKATRDGFTARSFHNLCDNQGATFSFIQSQQGYVFGGQTSLSWTSPDSTQCCTDNDAFVFNLTMNTLHKQYQNFDQAVNHHQDYLMAFGNGSNGSDIYISNDCNNNNSSYCCLGGTYMPPQGFKEGDQQAIDYMAGSEDFKVIEIEVYQVLV
ncbi:UNKNOWN [Stylonychia lemnae]|uniref:TLDc domain-containing protein n=1 Tax=Stylonychia lemnae TaxID=5949 RepID=A0A078AYF4_STYLE|nr:UNKNOWN [Stylonychia lemnae]|eukprot:CDW86247.1 UNKNOWN [Stylonychia lemnae]